MESEAIKKNEDRKRKISEKEKEVKKNEAGLQEDMHAANNLFKEANDRLASAIKKKDFKEILPMHYLMLPGPKKIKPQMPWRHVEAREIRLKAKRAK
jgi:hypothetical protein